MGRYGGAVDRDSAREMLARKLEAGAQAEEQERNDRQARARTDTDAEARRELEERSAREARASARSTPRTRRRSTPREEKSVVEQVVSSSVFRQFARTAGREIVRGIFGAARRRR
jgi:hypothetical protein